MRSGSIPGLEISLSSEVDPAFREYERTAVTAFDAYIRPTVRRYLTKLGTRLAGAGVTAPLQVMQSRGGLASAELARDRPVRLFLSGPAAGVIGGQTTGTAAGYDDLITLDVGGTSSDIALVSGAKPLLRAEGVIDGFPVRVPMVDVNAIGAGGGSIAWLDDAGGLRVGPHSAASDPGPACYARGGREPTVTDASVVLGYLDPEIFAGGGHSPRPFPGRGRDPASVSRSRSVWRSRTPRRAFIGWSMPRWRKESASSRCARGSTRASSRWSRWAAPGRCTRARWRPISASRA